jgi:hypothetical protein
MFTYFCGQRGCEFESTDMPDVCPVCLNPFIQNENYPVTKKVDVVEDITEIEEPVKEPRYDIVT